MGMVEEVRIHRLAERLLADREAGAAFGREWDASLTPQSMAEAYRVQDSVIRRMRARGAEPAGWRIALTTAAAQEERGVTHPVVGPVWREDIHPSPAEVAGEGAHAPVAGAELALRVSRPMEAGDGPWSSETVAGHVDAAAVAVGVFDDRHASGLAGYTIGLGIADLAGAVTTALGAMAQDLAELDLGALAFRTDLDGRDAGTCSTASYLAHPCEILSWVATHLNVRRRHLRAGDVVLLGCPGEPLPMGAGDRITVANDDLGAAELRLAGPSAAA